MIDWRDKPMTSRQMRVIKDMQEFSSYPIPLFTGQTRGEAYDYIKEYGKLAYENINSPTFGY